MESDTKNELYYKEKWIKTVEAAEFDENKKQIEIKYIDLIFAQMKDANQYAGRNKRKWKISEYSIIICTSIVAFLNTIAATILKFSSIINIIAAVLAAIISIINGVKVLSAYKETWLRHSKFRLSLIMECHNFSTDSGDYKIISANGKIEKDVAKEKIEKFKNNTAKLIQDDYDDFFKNMRSYR